MSKKINLVLSGGGIRGLAHIGVIKVLLEEGYEINEIAGCSIGAIIGGFYAATKDISFIEKLFVKNNAVHWGDPSISSLGLMKGSRLEKKLRELMPVKSFEKLKIPLRINATDLNSGEEVVFDKGPLIPAIRASSSFPGLFEPKVFRGKTLSDGGLINPVPISLVRTKHPVIVSDVSFEVANLRKKSLPEILKQSVIILQGNLITEKYLNSKKNFFVIKPDVREWGVFSINNDPEIILRGEREARRVLRRLKLFVNREEKDKKKF